MHHVFHLTKASHKLWENMIRLDKFLNCSMYLYAMEELDFHEIFDVHLSDIINNVFVVQESRVDFALLRRSHGHDGAFEFLFVGRLSFSDTCNNEFISQRKAFMSFIVDCSTWK